MRVKDLPRRERPRERLMESGAAALADRELLAVLLGSGFRGGERDGSGRAGDRALRRPGRSGPVGAASAARRAGGGAEPRRRAWRRRSI
ncbi:UPF0758 domain-containing protein [Nonomuraea ferruginea]